MKLKRKSELYMDKFKNRLYPVASLIFILVIWEVLVDIFQVNPVILPGPICIIKKIVVQYSSIISNSMNTLYGAVAGFLIGFVVAAILATLFQFSNFFKKTLLPLAVATRGIPPIAIAPIIVLWFGIDIFSKVTLTAFTSFFPILINLMKGLNSVPEEVLDLMKTFSATKWQVFAKVRIKYALPDLFAGLKVASSFAVVGAIISEYVGVTKGIGYIIKSSTYYSETDLTFAGIIAASLIGILLYWVIELIERKVVFWNVNK